MTALKLRPYQVQSIAAIKADWDSGLNAVLLVASMGAGKTVMLLQTLTDLLGAEKRGLILAHRLELVTQPLDKIREFWPEWESRTGTVMAEQNECDRQLTLATVQTLSREARLSQLLRRGPIDYVVRDEAHHSASKTDMALYAALRRANPNLKMLGVTATPIRADGDGLAKVYQKVSAKYGIKELIQLGYLVPFRALAVQTQVSLAGVATNDGDFVQSKLADVFEVDNVFDLVVSSHIEHAGDRPTICFTVSVEGAHTLARKFRDAGIAAEAADGTTKRSERSAVLDRFRSGETKVLCNVGIWTEGLDLPALACCHMVRPTQSDGLYCQCVGRVLRTFRDKEDALILDYKPEDDRNIVMAGDILGKPRAVKKAEAKAEQMQVLIPGLSQGARATGLDGEIDSITLRELDYLIQSPYHWHYSAGVSTLGLGERDQRDGTKAKLALAILPNDDKYTLYQIETAPYQRPSVTPKLVSDDFGEVRGVGQEIAESLGAPVLIGRGKEWQKIAGSDAQVNYFSRLRPDIKREDVVRMTRGQLAQGITHANALNALRRSGISWTERN